jgi:spore maturation protein CgeB
MNILLIQENGRHEENREFRECFSLHRGFKKLGINSTVWGLGHENFGQSINFEDFDLIINLENYGNGWEPNLKNVKTKKFLWSIDAHCRGEQPFINEFFSSNYNILLHSTKDYVNENYKIWFPNAFDDSLIYPIKTEKKFDVGFCGSLLNRNHYINFLSKNFKFKFDNFVIGKKMVEAINSYRIHWNKNLANDINYRSFETIGCGIPLVTNYNYQYEELGFKHMENVVFYKNDEELLENINLLLEDNILIEKIGINALELSKNHTYTKRCEKIIEIYNSL